MSDAPDPAATPAPKKKSKLPLILILLLLLGGGGGAAYYFLVMQAAPADGEEGVVALAPALYHPLRPSFVVNLEGVDANRFLQVEVDLMARDQAALDAVDKHNPAIRNNLLLIFGSQQYQSLQSREGKVALQARVLDEINKILAQREKNLSVEEIYFSSFVMQ